MAEALLILFGGRIVPNVLTILYLKPQIIVPIVSEDELKKLDGFKKGVDDLLQKVGHSCEWLNSEKGESFLINAYDKEDVKQICKKIIHNNKDKDDKGNARDYEWIFNITSGTSIMSIGAYEAAKGLKDERVPISCWYLNTARKRVEVLVGEPRNSLQDEALFRISIDQYATVHNKVLKTNPQEDSLPSKDKRLEFANFLLQNSTYIKTLNKLLIQRDDKTSVQNHISAQNKINRQNNLPKPEYYTCVFSSLTGDEKAVLGSAEKYGLIRGLAKTTTGWSFDISRQQNEFLKGGWLELYVHNEVANIKENGQPIFQDIGRNRHVYNKKGRDYNHEMENELDVSMIYNAQLFIIECKAGSEAKKSETIFKLDSVANAFGGGFVGKYLVTALSREEIKVENDRETEENKGQRDKSNLEVRLEIRKIKLIALDEFQDLKAIFRKEATDPEYSRM
jgi:hypothetical protein